jgi:hypothetical protein
MYLGSRGAGRLTRGMRWRAAAVIALFAIALIPGISGATAVIVGPRVHASVRPASGSPRTHFRITLKAAEDRGAIGAGHDIYRVTASDAGRGGCQPSASAVAPPTPAGATVRVTLAPGAKRTWCTGTFRGQVWIVVIPPCPIAKAARRCCRCPGWSASSPSVSRPADRPLPGRHRTPPGRHRTPPGGPPFEWVSPQRSTRNASSDDHRAGPARHPASANRRPRTIHPAPCPRILA